MNYIILISISAIVVIAVIADLIIKNKKCNNTIATSIEQPEITNPNLQTEDNEKEENSIVESSVSSETLSEDPKFANTNGDDEYYKDKLLDPRWIMMRDEIHKRDDYKCQQCRNCINTVYCLKDISDLNSKITKIRITKEFNEVISAVFSLKSYIIEDLLSDIVPRTCNLNYFLRVYNKEMKVYQYSYERISYFLTNDIPHNIPHNEIMSSNEINSGINYLDSDYSSKYKESPLYQMRKFNIRHFSDIHTDDKFIIKFNLGNTNKPELGQWSIHQNGFVVSFDGYLKPQLFDLNVHHKVYPKSGNPWDSNLDDLITLCSKCHIAEHERLGFKNTNKK